MSILPTRVRRAARAHRILTGAIAFLAAVLVAALLTALPAQGQPGGQHPARPTVVLVHGAWADSSSWDGVIRGLQRDHYPVKVFPTPLRSLSGDSAALRQYLDAITGPIVLVGHSYGGAVISNAATGDAQVKMLVYIDAFAPEQGETVLQLPGPGSALNQPTPVFDLVPATVPPTPATDLYVRADVFPAAFANDLPRATARVLAVTQRPVTYGALTQASGPPAWKTIPSYYEIGTRDKVIPADVQATMAHRAHATIRRVASSHLPMVSHPRDVVRTIELAAAASR